MWPSNIHIIRFDAYSRFGTCIVKAQVSKLPTGEFKIEGGGCHRDVLEGETGMVCRTGEAGPTLRRKRDSADGAARERTFFLRLFAFRAAAVFQLPDLAGLGYGLGLGFWVVFAIIVSLTLTITLFTTLTVILP